MQKMSEERAIVILKGAIKKPNTEDSYMGQALTMGIRALLKQTPKKIVKRKNVQYGTTYMCPMCEADQVPTEFFSLEGGEVKEKHTFCWKCGNCLDWSE